MHQSPNHCTGTQAGPSSRVCASPCTVYASPPHCGVTEHVEDTMDVDAQIRAGRALLDTLHLKKSEPIVGTNDPIVNPQTGTVMFDMYVAFDGVFLNVYVRDGAVHSVDCFDAEGVPPRTINDPVAAAEYLRYASIAAQTNTRQARKQIAESTLTAPVERMAVTGIRMRSFVKKSPVHVEADANSVAVVYERAKNDALKVCMDKDASLWVQMGDDRVRIHNAPPAQRNLSPAFRGIASDLGVNAKHLHAYVMDLGEHLEDTWDAIKKETALYSHAEAIERACWHGIMSDLKQEDIDIEVEHNQDTVSDPRTQEDAIMVPSAQTIPQDIFGGPPRQLSPARVDLITSQDPTQSTTPSPSQGWAL